MQRAGVNRTAGNVIRSASLPTRAYVGFPTQLRTASTKQPFKSPTPTKGTLASVASEHTALSTYVSELATDPDTILVRASNKPCKYGSNLAAYTFPQDATVVHVSAVDKPLADALSEAEQKLERFGNMNAIVIFGTRPTKQGIKRPQADLYEAFHRLLGTNHNSPVAKASAVIIARNDIVTDTLVGHLNTESAAPPQSPHKAVRVTELTEMLDNYFEKLSSQITRENKRSHGSLEELISTRIHAALTQTNEDNATLTGILKRCDGAVRSIVNDLSKISPPPKGVSSEELSSSIVSAVSKEMKRLLKDHEAPGVTAEDIAAVSDAVGATIEDAVQQLASEISAKADASRADSSKLLAQVSVGFEQLNSTLAAQAEAVRSLTQKKSKSCTTEESVARAMQKVASEQAARTLPSGVRVERDALEMSIFPNVPVSRLVDAGLASTVAVRDAKGPVRYAAGAKLPANANVIFVQMSGKPLADGVCVAEAAYVASQFDADTSLPAVVVFSGAPRAGEKPQQSAYESLHRMLSQAKTLSIGKADHVVITDGSKLDLASLASELKGADDGSSALADMVVSRMRPLVDRTGEADVAKLVGDLNKALSSGLLELNAAVQSAAEAQHSPAEVASALDGRLGTLRKELTKAIEANSPSEIDPEELSSSIVSAVSKEMKRLLKDHEAPGVTAEDIAAVSDAVGATIEDGVSRLEETLRHVNKDTVSSLAEVAEVLKALTSSVESSRSASDGFSSSVDKALQAQKAALDDVGVTVAVCAGALEATSDLVSGLPGMITEAVASALSGTKLKYTEESIAAVTSAVLVGVGDLFHGRGTQEAERMNVLTTSMKDGFSSVDAKLALMEHGAFGAHGIDTIATAVLAKLDPLIASLHTGSVSADAFAALRSEVKVISESVAKRLDAAREANAADVRAAMTTVGADAVAAVTAEVGALKGEVMASMETTERLVEKVASDVRRLTGDAVVSKVAEAVAADVSTHFTDMSGQHDTTMKELKKLANVVKEAKDAKGVLSRIDGLHEELAVFVKTADDAASQQETNAESIARMAAKLDTLSELVAAAGDLSTTSASNLRDGVAADMASLNEALQALNKTTADNMAALEATMRLQQHRLDEVVTSSNTAAPSTTSVGGTASDEALLEHLKGLMGAVEGHAHKLADITAAVEGGTARTKHLVADAAADVISRLNLIEDRARGVAAQHTQTLEAHHTTTLATVSNETARVLQEIAEAREAAEHAAASLRSVVEASRTAVTALVDEVAGTLAANHATTTSLLSEQSAAMQALQSGQDAMGASIAELPTLDTLRVLGEEQGTNTINTTISAINASQAAIIDAVCSRLAEDLPKRVEDAVAASGLQSALMAHTSTVVGDAVSTLQGAIDAVGGATKGAIEAVGTAVEAHTTASATQYDGLLAAITEQTALLQQAMEQMVADKAADAAKAQEVVALVESTLRALLPQQLDTVATDVVAAVQPIATSTADGITERVATLLDEALARALPVTEDPTTGARTTALATRSEQAADAAANAQMVTDTIAAAINAGNAATSKRIDALAEAATNHREALAAATREQMAELRAAFADLMAQYNKERHSVKRASDEEAVATASNAAIMDAVKAVADRLNERLPKVAEEGEEDSANITQKGSDIVDAVLADPRTEALKLGIVAHVYEALEERLQQRLGHLLVAGTEEGEVCGLESRLAAHTTAAVDAATAALTASVAETTQAARDASVASITDVLGVRTVAFNTHVDRANEATITALKEATDALATSTKDTADAAIATFVSQLDDRADKLGVNMRGFMSKLGKAMAYRLRKDSDLVKSITAIHDKVEGQADDIKSHLDEMLGHAWENHTNAGDEAIRAVEKTLKEAMVQQGSKMDGIAEELRSRADDAAARNADAMKTTMTETLEALLERYVKEAVASVVEETRTIVNDATNAVNESGAAKIYAAADRINAAITNEVPAAVNTAIANRMSTITDTMQVHKDTSDAKMDRLREAVDDHNTSTLRATEDLKELVGRTMEEAATDRQRLKDALAEERSAAIADAIRSTAAEATASIIAALPPPPTPVDVPAAVNEDALVSTIVSQVQGILERTLEAEMAKVPSLLPTPEATDLSPITDRMDALADRQREAIDGIEGLKDTTGAVQRQLDAMAADQQAAADRIAAVRDAVHDASSITRESLVSLEGAVRDSADSLKAHAETHHDTTVGAIADLRQLVQAVMDTQAQHGDAISNPKPIDFPPMITADDVTAAVANATTVPMEGLQSMLQSLADRFAQREATVDAAMRELQQAANEAANRPFPKFPTLDVAGDVERVVTPIAGDLRQHLSTIEADLKAMVAQQGDVSADQQRQLAALITDRTEQLRDTITADVSNATSDVLKAAAARDMLEDLKRAHHAFMAEALPSAVGDYIESNIVPSLRQQLTERISTAFERDIIPNTETRLLRAMEGHVATVVAAAEKPPLIDFTPIRAEVVASQREAKAHMDAIAEQSANANADLAQSLAATKRALQTAIDDTHSTTTASLDALKEAVADLQGVDHAQLTRDAHKALTTRLERRIEDATATLAEQAIVGRREDREALLAAAAEMLQQSRKDNALLQDGVLSALKATAADIAAANAAAIREAHAEVTASVAEAAKASSAAAAAQLAATEAAVARLAEATANTAAQNKADGDMMAERYADAITNQEAAMKHHTAAVIDAVDAGAERASAKGMAYWGKHLGLLLLAGLTSAYLFLYVPMAIILAGGGGDKDEGSGANDAVPQAVTPTNTTTTANTQSQPPSRPFHKRKRFGDDLE